MNFRKPWVWLLLIIALWGLLIGLLAPWIIKKQVITTAKERLDLTLDIKRLRINPYAFTVTVEQMSATEANGEPLAGFERLYINFETFSLFRWAWSLKQAHLLGVYTNIERYSETSSNFSRLADRWQATAPPDENIEPPATPDSKNSITRFFIEDIQLQIKEINITDKVPATDFHTNIGPINLQVAQLTTLPDKIGRQQLSLQMANDAHIQWNGSLALAPLKSEGEVTINGRLLTTATEYLTDHLNFTVPSGDLAIAFSYNLQTQQNRQTTQDNQALTLQLHKLNTQLNQLQILDKQTKQPLFKLQQLAIRDGELRWPEKTLTINHIDFNNGELFVERAKNGEINLTQLIAHQTTEAEAEAEQQQEATASPTTDNTPAWKINNDTLSLSDWQIHWVDSGIAETANIDISALNLQLHNVSNQAEKPIQADLNTHLANGRINASATLTPIPLGDIHATIQLEELQLNTLQPYIASFARINLTEGTITSGITVTSDTENNLAISSNLNLANLNIETLKNRRKILGWDSLIINDAKHSLKNQNTEISGVILNQPYVDFAIDKAGNTTVQEVLVEKPASNETQTTHSDADKDTEKSNIPPLSIASITINNATGKFSDQSLPLPFNTTFSELNGNVTTIDSQSTEPSTIAMKGRIDEYGLMKVNGALTPFNPQQQTHIDLAFKNVDVPNLSPYSIKFAGRTIEKGRLNLDLGYQIKNGQLQGSNTVEIQKLTLGKRIDQPGALDLPLDLAVALLKDGKGNIEVNLPVAGDMNNPQFGYGKVVGQALKRLITSIVSSPFRLLAKLAGNDSENFDEIHFYPGSSEITPPEQEKLKLLQKALEQRPMLKLLIGGVYTPETDTSALQEEQFKTLEITTFGKDKLASLARTSAQYRKFIEQRYLETHTPDDLKDVEQKNTHSTQQNTKPELDALAYVTELREKLIRQQSIDPPLLTSLARHRAENIQNFLSSTGLNTETRVEITEVKAVKPEKDAKVIALKLKLGG